VTAAAALDTGRFHANSEFDDPGYCTEYGKRVYNFADQSGPERFGSVNFTQALQHSINAVFCEIGKKLGPLKILEYTRKFGFYSEPPLETPSSERQPSGLYDHGRLFFPHDPNQVDPGRLGFGQESHLEVTPLQMAMVAAGIANGGLVMDPQLVQKVTAPGGRVSSSLHPRELGRALSPQTADELTAMMELVVRAGTGTAGQLPGIPVAGKTGTAETGIAHVNTAWFIAFAPADAPRVAIAVVLERQSATGGAVSAPIAREVLQALLPTGTTP
jgi:peptidoglycan glycosyltransferase